MGMVGTLFDQDRDILKHEWKEAYSNLRAQRKCGNQTAEALLYWGFETVDYYIWKSWERNNRFNQLTIMNPNSRHFDGVPF